MPTEQHEAENMLPHQIDAPVAVSQVADGASVNGGCVPAKGPSAPADRLASHGKAQHPHFADRNADGTLRPGNAAAVRHGAYSASVQRGEVPDLLRVDVRTLEAQILTDLGGVENLSAIQAALVRKLVDAEVIERLLVSHLARVGVLTAKGNVRGALNKWLDVVNTWDRLAMRLGLERKARTVDPIEALRRAVDEVNRK